MKIDPYLNVDAGTLGPLEYVAGIDYHTRATTNGPRHGECFVLADGGESDLDLGNYERYSTHYSCLIVLY